MDDPRGPGDDRRSEDLWAGGAEEDRPGGESPEHLDGGTQESEDASPFPGEEVPTPTPASVPPGPPIPERPAADEPSPVVPERTHRRPRRLTRSTRDRILGGVAGGIARYFEVDAVLVRVAIVVLFFVTGFFPVGIGYVVAWAVIPEETEQEGAEARSASRSAADAGGGRFILGIVLIVAGGYFLLQTIVPRWLEGELLAAAVLIVVGGIILAQGLRR